MPVIEKIKKSTLMCYLLPLVLIFSYLFILVKKGLIKSSEGYYMIHYLYDYSHGFVARGLVGEVIRHLTDTVTDEVTYKAVLLFSILLALSSALCIGKALNAVKDDNERFAFALFLILVACFLPFSLKAYFIDIRLDKLLWALTFFAVFLSGNKAGIFLVPPLCIIATLVNPVFLFCSMILISIIMLQRFYSEGYKVTNGILCLVAYVSMIAIGIYGVISEGRLGFSSPTELIEYYFSKYSGGMPESQILFEKEWLFDYFDSGSTVLKKAFDIYFIQWENWKNVIFNTVFFALPVFSLLSAFWVRVIKAEQNRFQKFIFFLCLISPVVLILPIIGSWESAKYFANNLLVQLCLIIYYIATNSEPVVATLSRAKAWFGEHIIAGSAAVAYFAFLLV